jgi:DUF1016 N-terminal domain
MAKKRASSRAVPATNDDDGYQAVLADVSDLLESARRAAARSVNSVMTITYWKVGRRIVEDEQGGKRRADYGTRLIERLSGDLSKRFGRGFGVVNLTQMRKLYQLWPMPQIVQTVSEESTGLAERHDFPRTFPLSWSHYVNLMSVAKPEARVFYETEALRGGWNSRQLARQISTQFYERTMLSRDKAAMLTKGRKQGTAQIPAFLCSKGFWAILLALMVVFSDLRLGQGSQRSDG